MPPLRCSRTRVDVVVVDRDFHRLSSSFIAFHRLSSSVVVLLELPDACMVQDVEIQSLRSQVEALRKDADILRLQNELTSLKATLRGSSSTSQLGTPALGTPAVGTPASRPTSTAPWDRDDTRMRSSASSAALSRRTTPSRYGRPRTPHHLAV